MDCHESFWVHKPTLELGHRTVLVIVILYHCGPYATNPNKLVNPRE